MANTNIRYMSAASPVLPGDTIFVKGGNYGNENVVLKRVVPGSPITIIGYKNTPGDSPYCFDKQCKCLRILYNNRNANIYRSSRATGNGILT